MADDMGIVPITIPSHLLLRSAPEGAFRDALRAAARERGWIVLTELPDAALLVLAAELDRRAADPTGSEVEPLFPPPGWPDLVLGRKASGDRPARVIFCELKMRERRPSWQQERTLRLLAAVGCEVHVWRPTDWPAILEALQ